MKQELEQYRRTIRMRCWLWGSMILLAVGQIIYGQFLADQTIQNNVVFGFQAGFGTGVAIVGLMRLIHYQKVLRTDKLLQMEYNEDHDERMQYIRAKAGMPMLLVTSCVMVIVGIISGYFNVTVFMTLSAAAMCQLLVGSAVKMYYMKKTIDSHSGKAGGRTAAQIV